MTHSKFARVVCAVTLLAVAHHGRGSADGLNADPREKGTRSTSVATTQPSGASSESKREATDTAAATQRSGQAGLANLKQRQAFLRGRVEPSIVQMSGMGSFNGVASLLYATGNVTVYCSSEETCRTQLVIPFPDFYQPTWAEYFNAIARQTGTSWTYDEDKNGFSFSDPAMPLPFELKAVKGWDAEERGMYVSYIPAQAPVGMDIYMLGEYSADNEPGKLQNRVRDAWALRFASSFDDEITTDKMRRIQLCGAESLFFESVHKETGRFWLQWVFVKNNACFAIVSASEAEHHKTIREDVEKMVASFKIRPGKPEPPDPTSPQDNRRPASPK